MQLNNKMSQYFDDMYRRSIGLKNIKIKYKKNQEVASDFL